MAQVQAAGLALQNGDLDQATALYKDLSDNASDKNIRQLAFYMALNISQDMDTAQKGTALMEIITDENNPWRYHAMMDKAVLDAVSNSDYTQARTHLVEIMSAKAAPQTLKQKAQSLDVLYALKEKI